MVNLASNGDQVGDSSCNLEGYIDNTEWLSITIAKPVLPGIPREPSSY